MSFLDQVPEAPPDVIFGLKTRYLADPAAGKINLGIGAYRTEELKPYVLNVVKKAEVAMANGTESKEYLPIDGDQTFARLSAELAFGTDSPALKDNRVAHVQALSGTGALRLMFEFIHRHFPAGTKLYFSNPTWGNHKAIAREAGVESVDYRYYHPPTRGFDYEGMLADLQAAPDRSAVLLHACAHNPTGVDPTQDQWKGIADVIKSKGHFPIFDNAYQGYATGDLEADAWAIRHFAALGLELAVCQSYSKNLGLYAERAGCTKIICPTADAARAVQSQLKTIVRPMYSNPPCHGVRIVKSVLGNPELYSEWKTELAAMSSRITEMRSALRAKLEANGAPGTWEHITNQIGMFSFTGLQAHHAAYLERVHHIYLLSNGRISMAGLNKNNVGVFADAVKDALAQAKA